MFFFSYDAYIHLEVMILPTHLYIQTLVIYVRALQIQHLNNGVSNPSTKNLMCS